MQKNGIGHADFLIKAKFKNTLIINTGTNTDNALCYTLIAHMQSFIQFFVFWEAIGHEHTTNNILNGLRVIVRVCVMLQFAGFSADSLSERIMDSQCCLLITSGKSCLM